MSDVAIKQTVFPIDDPQRYQEAGASDLIALRPVQGCNSICIEKSRLEVLFYALANGEFLHLGGPTGCGKTAVLEALAWGLDNFELLCRAYGYPVAPLRLHPIEMVTFDTPGELIQRRGLQAGSTFDEESCLIAALREAAKQREAGYQVIWLRELGRVHAPSVQGGLLDLMTHGNISLPNGDTIPGDGIGWVADSNYRAEYDAVHVLATFDDALKRRFTVNLGLDYMAADQELEILRYLTKRGDIPAVADDLLLGIVELGQAVRSRRHQGGLQSVTPPTIYGYMAFVRLSYHMPHLNISQVAQATFLGNANTEDADAIPTVLGEVFGIRSDFDDDPTVGGTLF